MLPPSVRIYLATEATDMRNYAEQEVIRSRRYQRSFGVSPYAEFCA